MGTLLTIQPLQVLWDIVDKAKLKSKYFYRLRFSNCVIFDR